ncbi:MAG: acyltransferase family protein, partial [Verrucomicrobiales bacterium]
MSFIAAQNRYRPDIDGLRALAVVAVILYHAEIPGFPGGFVGVDVFFVISGFLITGILARSFSSGTFSLIEFYERRARRILPALFVVALGVLAAAPFLIHAWDLAPIGRNLKYVVTSVANLDFYKTLSNYSGDDASLTPMLHTWSLSVEEQFYIVIPFLWMLLSRFTGNPSHWLKLFAGAALVSFAANLWMLPRDQSACFFLLPYRAWELAAGGILALSPLPKLTPMASRMTGLAGLLMILAASVWFSHETPFPGPWALLPCLGAILVILSGLGEKATLPQRILSSRPFVFVGLISYSLYLVHWPVLVFSGYQEQYSGKAMTGWGTAGLLALIFLGGWLSWRVVEKPFRRSGFWTRRRIFVFAWTGAAALFGLGYFYQKSPVFLKLLPEGARELAEARFSSNPLLKGEQSQEEVDNYYRYGSSEVEPDTVLWGDSHAAVLAYPLHELALSNNRSFLAYGRNSTP